MKVATVCCSARSISSSQAKGQFPQEGKHMIAVDCDGRGEALMGSLRGKRVVL